MNDDFYIMCTNGKLFKLFNLEESAFSQSVLESSTRSVENETLISATLDRITNTKYSHRLNAFCLIETWEGWLTVISGEEYIYFQTQEQITKIKYPAGIKPIKKILNLENYIIGLTTDGEFVEICLVQKILYKMKGCKSNKLEPIDDLVVLEANDESIELLTLSNPTNGLRAMKIIDFPSFQCKYEMMIPEVAWLVPQAKLSANMYFVHGSLNDSGFVQSIEMKMISEADPDQRLKKLVQRGLFSEAEAFAKQFDLNLQLIYEAKVKKALMEISVIVRMLFIL